MKYIISYIIIIKIILVSIFFIIKEWTNTTKINFKGRKQWLRIWCFCLAPNNGRVITCKCCICIFCISSDITHHCIPSNIVTIKCVRGKQQRHTSYNCVQMASMKETCMLGILSLFSRFIRSWEQQQLAERREDEIRSGSSDVPDLLWLYGRDLSMIQCGQPQTPYDVITFV